MISKGLTEAQQRRIYQALETVPYARLMGFKLGAVEPGRATLTLEVRPELKQNRGVVHGGAIASLIDTATAFAILTTLAEGEQATTVDLTINYLKPLISGTAAATGRILRAGARIIVVAADVVDAEGNLVATALSSYLRRANS